ncbi:MAG: gluconate 2-dehydrogenase subunit 3 family protein [Sphingomonadales bacterium]|nr:gluconate 2-dehydrogenase subunit 3 family protein [Sphingomonadales bacterium]MDE2171297.1 gluconate 2-dehydrogenase subunit 3 family protein [Sphingomonadales bacterium]
MTEQAWNRRTFLGAATALAAALGVSPARLLAGLPASEAPTARHSALLREVSQLVIPRTDTAGAGDVGTGAFVSLALAHGLKDTRAPIKDAPAGWPLRADGSLRHDLWLERTLDQRAGGDFLARPPAQRHALLAALDAEAFPAGPPPAVPSPWRAIKALILTGYYTSEEGGSKELRYEAVPGRWDPDIALHKGDRAFSSDWTAVDFG